MRLFKHTILLSLFPVLFSSASLAQAQDLSKIYQEVVPGIVLIEVTGHEIIGQREQRQEVSVSGLGTGFLIDEEHIITAAHVVQTAEVINIHFYDEEAILAEVVAISKSADVALLKLNWKKKNPHILKLGDSDDIQIGNQVFIVGAPLGLAYSFSSGYISGRFRSNKISNAFTSMEFFQTDASINHGNSGGPMFNTRGEVIGIVSYILSQSGGFEGIGFAATSNIAREVLFDGGVIWTGIDGYFLKGEMSKVFNLPQPEGMLIQRVVPLSPLGEMGIRGGTMTAEVDGEELLLGGDIVLSVNGITLASDAETLARISELLKATDGQEVPDLELKVLRAGQIITVK